MPNYRIKSDDEDTYFGLRMAGQIVQIIAESKQKKIYQLANINTQTGALQLFSHPELVFEELGIDYKKRNSGGGYVWNVEE